jgi:hypothetical protein
MYSSHVHNITYLQNHHSINAKDLRQIVEQIEPQARKRYDYDALEELYNHFMDRKIDDHTALDTLERAFTGKEILLIAPGKSIDAYRGEIQALSSRENVITVSVNFLPQEFAVDYVFYNNPRRYEHSVDLDRERLADSQQIVTSNLPGNILVGKPLQLNFDTLAKRGWKNYDNSMIFAIRLALRLGAQTIRLAGLDGFNEDSAPNFSSKITARRMRISQVCWRRLQDTPPAVSTLSPQAASARFWRLDRYARAGAAQPPEMDRAGRRRHPDRRQNHLRKRRYGDEAVSCSRRRGNIACTERRVATDDSDGTGK